MARDDEQGVVDPDAKADKNPEDGHKTCHCEDLRHEAGESKPDPDGNERRDYGDHSGQYGAKRGSRKLLAGELGLTEQKMFGGLAFLIDGNMAVAASGQGGLMVRVDPLRSQELVAQTPAYLVEMRGRQMPGWLRVGSEHLQGAAELTEWVKRGTTYARSLPAKR